MTVHRGGSGGAVERLRAGHADADDPVDAERGEMVHQAFHDGTADALRTVRRIDHDVQDVGVAYAVGERARHADQPSALIERAIASKHVTYDFARQMEGATELRCSEFARVIADNM